MKEQSKEQSETVETPEVAEAASCQAGASGCEAAEAEVVEENTDAAEVVRLKDRLLRLQADFDNYRKRMARDHIEMIKRANEDLLESLLPVLDHFGHAEASLEKDAHAGRDVKAYLDGFRMVHNELLRVLDSYGVKPIEAIGKVFDATCHDAVSMMPSADAEPGTVLFESRKGYWLNGRVLRPAQVVVVAERDEAAAEQPKEQA